MVSVRPLGEELRDITAAVHLGCSIRPLFCGPQYKPSLQSCLCESSLPRSPS
jgi:hypothetical protein